ncbi:MAG: hypothetical protein HGB23_09620 [Chlorobiaceae bacterium]|nr:hypothetical protein [Chlorobiaceae bacterium]
MKHYASSRFWVCYHSLPKPLQELAKESYKLLRHDSSHPSLHFKKVKNGHYRSVRIGKQYRALGIPVQEGVQWF